MEGKKQPRNVAFFQLDQNNVIKICFQSMVSDKNTRTYTYVRQMGPRVGIYYMKRMLKQNTN